MNVTVSNEKAVGKKQIIIYISIVLFCIIAIIVAGYVEFYTRTEISELLGIKQSEYKNKSEDEKETLKQNFEHIFTSKESDIVKIGLSKQVDEQNNYNINVNIPYINLDGEIIEKYNSEIKSIFESKLNSILTTSNKNIIYTVEYESTFQDDILSLIIKANLKEGANAQRIIIKTYNYDLRNNKEISLKEILDLKKVETEVAQQQINETIRQEEEKVKALKQLGYSIYNRNLQDDIYKISNSSEYYFTGENLYVIYAYGNNSNTSEMDIVIF